MWSVLLVTIIIVLNNFEIKKTRTAHYPSSSIAPVTAFVTHGQTFMARLKSKNKAICSDLMPKH